jgi:hypothetical protein
MREWLLSGKQRRYLEIEGLRFWFGIWFRFRIRDRIRFECDDIWFRTRGLWVWWIRH